METSFPSLKKLHMRVQHTPISVSLQWCILYKTEERGKGVEEEDKDNLV
jgi:hypothetical protein